MGDVIPASLAPDGTVIVTDALEWSRILDHVKPSPLYVSNDRQWFKNGFGITFIRYAHT